MEGAYKRGRLYFKMRTLFLVAAGLLWVTAASAQKITVVFPATRSSSAEPRMQIDDTPKLQNGFRYGNQANRSRSETNRSEESRLPQPDVAAKSLLYPTTSVRKSLT